MILTKLDDLNNTIKAKPEHNLGIENVVLGAMDIVRKTKSGNDIVYNRYKVKK